VAFDNQRGTIAARMSTQQTFQHNNADSINWTQWRNELRFDLRYDILGQGTGKTWGPINSLRFNLLYRARMDPVYLLRDSYQRRDYDRGDFIFPEGKTPRELFFDIGFQGALSDFSLRIGKQQVVWGEADLFRSLDVVNPLDLRQSGFLGEDFADFRQPLWIAKGFYNIGSVASFLNNAGLEFFVSPNSRPQVSQQNLLLGSAFKIQNTQSVVGPRGITRNMSTDFNQVRSPWEILRIGARPGDAPAVVQNADGTLTDFWYLAKNDVPPSELSLDAMMAGVRLLGSTYGNADFTLNYIFKRSDIASASPIISEVFDPAQPGTGNPIPEVLVRALGVNPATGQLNIDPQTGFPTGALSPDLNGNGIPDGQDQQVLNCLQKKLTNGHGELIVDPRAVNPAFTGEWHGSVYSDPAHPELATGVSKPGVNQIRSDNVPYQPVLPVPGDGLAHNSACLTVIAFHPWTHIIGTTMTYNDSYTGLIFRLEESFSTKEPRLLSWATPERLLDQKNNPGDPSRLAVPNKRDFETRTKRYSGVWRSMVGFDYLRSISTGLARTTQNGLLRSLLSDPWFFSFQFLNEYNTHADHTAHFSSFSDRYQTWNPFLTFVGTGLFMHANFRPTLAVALDANQMYPTFFFQGAYSVTRDLEVRLGEIIYAGSKNQEDNNFIHYYSDRDTFFFRLTYFLA
jgi:hypothetical protein